MNRSHVVVMLIAGFAITACSKSEGTGDKANADKTNPSNKPVESVAAAAREESPAYKNDAGRYTVRWPRGNPTESEKPDVQKPELIWHDAKSPIGAYSVMYADFKDAAAAKKHIDGYVAAMKTHTRASTEVTVSGRKAQELEMKISETATMWIRVFADGAREYRVGAGTKNNAAQAHDFLDSFQLTTK